MQMKRKALCFFLAFFVLFFVGCKQKEEVIPTTEPILSKESETETRGEYIPLPYRPPGTPEEISTKLCEEISNSCKERFGSKPAITAYGGVYGEFVTISICFISSSWDDIYESYYEDVIGGVSFFRNRQLFVVYRRGKLWTLQEAYDLGSLTKDDVLEISERLSYGHTKNDRDCPFYVANAWRALYLTELKGSYSWTAPEMKEIWIEDYIGEFQLTDDKQSLMYAAYLHTPESENTPSTKERIGAYEIEFPQGKSFQLLRFYATFEGEIEEHWLSCVYHYSIQCTLKEAYELGYLTEAELLEMARSAGLGISPVA